jgi:hypothetical protein
MRKRNAAEARRGRPNHAKTRGTIATLDDDGASRGVFARGNSATGTLIVESDALRWRWGYCR